MRSDAAKSDVRWVPLSVLVSVTLFLSLLVIIVGPRNLFGYSAVVGMFVGATWVLLAMFVGRRRDVSVARLLLIGWAGFVIITVLGVMLLPGFPLVLPMAGYLVCKLAWIIEL
jgi:hypothetical protein